MQLSCHNLLIVIAVALLGNYFFSVRYFRFLPFSAMEVGACSQELHAPGWQEMQVD
jgi:hypothetical protein